MLYIFNIILNYLLLSVLLKVEIANVCTEQLQFNLFWTKSLLLNKQSFYFMSVTNKRVVSKQSGLNPIIYSQNCLFSFGEHHP
jgi:hypothetical protein